MVGSGRRAAVGRRAAARAVGRRRTAAWVPLTCGIVPVVVTGLVAVGSVTPASAVQGEPPLTLHVFAGHDSASVEAFLADGVPATAVAFTLTDSSGLVQAFVDPVAAHGVAGIDARRLHDGRTYTVQARTVGDGGVFGDAARTTLRPTAAARLLVGTARQGAGATLPFTVALSGPCDEATTGVLAVDWTDGPDGVRTTVPVGVPAGATVVGGAIAVPSGLFDDAAGHYVTAHFLPDDPTSVNGGDSVRTSLVWGAASAAPIVVSAPAVSVPEGDGSASVQATAALAPAPAQDLGLGSLRSGTASGRLDVAAGATTAVVSLPVPGDLLPAGDRTEVFGFDLPPAWGPPVVLPAGLEVTTVDDDPDGAVGSVAVRLTDHDGVATGSTSWAHVDVANLGDQPLKQARLTGEIAAADARVLVTGPRGVCSVTPRAGGPGVAFTCPLGALRPGQQGEVAVEYALAGAVSGLPLTVRLTGADAGGARAAQAQALLSAAGPTCTVVGTLPAGTAAVTGTSGDDVLCGPWRVFGPLVRFVPGAGDDLVLGAGVLDYSQAPGPIRDAPTATGVRITGWGTDEFRGLPDETVAFQHPVVTASVVGSAFDDTFGPHWVSVQAGAGRDVVWLDPRAWARHAVTVDGGPGVDVVKVASRPDLPAAVSLADPQLLNVEQIVGGPGDDVLTGAAGANTLRGGAGDDTIDVADGVGGNDTVVGGDGDDTCRADVGDRVTGCEQVTWVPAR